MYQGYAVYFKSDYEPMSMEMLEDISDRSQYHSDVNRRYTRYKISDFIKQRQSKWKGALKAMQNMFKGSHKLFKTVVKYISKYYHLWVKLVQKFPI